MYPSTNNPQATYGNDACEGNRKIMMAEVDLKCVGFGGIGNKLGHRMSDCRVEKSDGDRKRDGDEEMMKEMDGTS